VATKIIRSPDLPARGGRERLGVFALAGVVVTVVVVYLVWSAVGGRDDTRGLLPYQSLVGALPASDREQFHALRSALLTAEAERAKASRWPEAAALALPGGAYHWTRFQQGVVTSYLGRPRDAAQPAWLLEIQEPEAGMLPDPAPNDEEHHRLPDGTTLHIYVWTHPIGGEVPDAAVPQPQNTGWTELFSAVPNPVYAIRR
jgi:hypothetical protein